MGEIIKSLDDLIDEAETGFYFRSQAVSGGGEWIFCKFGEWINSIPLGVVKKMLDGEMFRFATEAEE